MKQSAQQTIPPVETQPIFLKRITLEELFNEWKDACWNELGASSRIAANAAYKHCIALAQWQYRDINTPQMQWCVDNSKRSYAMQSQIKALWRQLDRFAQETGVLPKIPSEGIVVAPAPELKYIRFTDDEIALLWAHVEKPWVDTALFQLYTGARRTELISIQVRHVDLQANTIWIGETAKPEAWRLVPIHPKLRPIIEKWLITSSGDYLIEYHDRAVGMSNYRVIWKKLMDDLQLPHTPNHCRNTFKKQMEKVNVRPKLQKALMDYDARYAPNGQYTAQQIQDLQQAVASLYA